MKYLYFTFDGVSSSKFGLFYINQGEDLTFPFLPSFNDNIVTPMYQGSGYLAGVDITNRQIQFKCWVDAATPETVNNIRQWLNTEKIGDLVLDHELAFKYRAKITNLSNFAHYFQEENKTSYEFSITFTTVESPYAISVQEFQANEIAPNGLRTSVADSGTVYLNYYHTKTPFKIEYPSNTTTISVQKNGSVVYGYTGITSGAATLNSEMGFITRGNDLIENFTSNAVTNVGGVFFDPTKNPIIKTTPTVSGSSVTINTTELKSEENLYLGFWVAEGHWAIARVTNQSTFAGTIVASAGSIHNKLCTVYPAVGTKISNGTGTLKFRYRDKR